MEEILGISSKKSYDAVSLTKIFSRYIVVIILVLGLSAILVAFFFIKSSTHSLYKEYVGQEKKAFEIYLENYISSRVKNLIDHARQPIFVNSVMNPQNDMSYLKDYMDSLRVQGDEVSLIMADIDGHILLSTKSPLLNYYANEENFDSLIEGDLGSFSIILKSQGIVYIRHMVPILYNNYPEGMLIAESQLDIDHVLGYVVSENSDFFVEVMAGNFNIVSIGNSEFTSFVEEVIDIQGTKNRLRLRINTEAIWETLWSTSASMLVVTIFLMAFFLIIFRKLGVKLFVEPQQLLAQAKHEVDDINSRLTSVNNELSQFAYRTSHDLKAPLVSIRGLCKCIEEDMADEDFDEVVKNISKIKKCCLKLEGLIVDILALARAELVEEEYKSLDLNHLMDEILHRCEYLSLDKNVRIVRDFHVDDDVSVPQGALNSILENLVTNGIKYSANDRNDSYVCVGITTDERLLKIEVTDNGIGIPEEYQSKVFEMFTRLSSKNSFGSGLGLYIVKKHVDKLNGSIELSSSEQGSVFRVSLPYRILGSKYE